MCVDGDMHSPQAARGLWLDGSDCEALMFPLVLALFDISEPMASNFLINWQLTDARAHKKMRSQPLIVLIVT